MINPSITHGIHRFRVCPETSLTGEGAELVFGVIVPEGCTTPPTCRVGCRGGVVVDSAAHACTLLGLQEGIVKQRTVDASRFNVHSARYLSG